MNDADYSLFEAEYRKLNVIGCKPCAEDRDDLVLLGMTYEQYGHFSRNHIIMRCPVCGYTAGKLQTEMGEPTGREDWLPIYLPSLQPWLKTLRLTRIPATDEKGVFSDARSHGTFKG